MARAAAGLAVLALLGAMILGQMVLGLRAENDALVTEVAELSASSQALVERVQDLEAEEEERSERAKRREQVLSRPDPRGEPAPSKEEALRYVLTVGADTLSREARVVPNFVDGRSSGFKLFAIRRRSNLRVLGFRNNDVITAINGKELTGFDSLPRVFEAEEDAPRWTLSVQRDDQPLELTFERPEGM